MEYKHTYLKKNTLLEIEKASIESTHLQRDYEIILTHCENSNSFFPHMFLAGGIQAFGHTNGNGNTAH